MCKGKVEQGIARLRDLGWRGGDPWKGNWPKENEEPSIGEKQIKEAEVLTPPPLHWEINCARQYAKQGFPDGQW